MIRGQVNDQVEVEVGLFREKSTHLVTIPETLGRLFVHQ